MQKSEPVFTAPLNLKTVFKMAQKFTHPSTLRFFYYFRRVLRLKSHCEGRFSVLLLSVRPLVCCFCLFALSITIADNNPPPSPVKALQQSADTLLQTLQQQKAKGPLRPATVYQIVQRILLPQVDLTAMAQRILSPSIWHEANEHQRHEFLEILSIVLVRTYASALTTYTDEKIVFMPPRNGRNHKRTQIDSKLYRGKELIHNMSYYLLLDRENHWKLYDF